MIAAIFIGLLWAVVATTQFIFLADRVEDLERKYELLQKESRTQTKEREG